jgi:murein DD-endopeptidase MepM/ murein hydrolase activator NlpD
LPSTPSSDRNTRGSRPKRSARVDTFARLRDGLPLQTRAVVDASAGDQMHVRSLLIAIICAMSALFAGVGAAVAEDPAPDAGVVTEQALCIAPDGTVIAAPAGTPAGPPATCPEGYPPSSAPTPAPPAPPAEPGPPAPETAPAPQPEAAPAPAPAAPPAAAPQTAAPGTVTVEPQAIEPGDGIYKAQPKLKRQDSSKQTTREQTVGGDQQDSGKPSKEDNPPNAPAVDDRPLVFAPAAPPRSVPNILLDRFEIPPFLLPLYQAAGVQYGVRWEILAAINSIETDYGRNLSVSSAGALGWMQFMPATWEMYGVDANGDGVKDPYNPVDAIFAAARYLKAAGAGDSLRRAIWAYNHADWYVDDVLGRAQAISQLPDEVVASLSGLTLGRFPVAARATYADRISTKAARAAGPNASVPVAGDSNRRGMRIYTSAGAPVVAVQDGVVVGMGRTKRLGNFVRLRDAYGNRYVYGHLASIAENHPVPRKRTTSRRSIRRELGLDGKDPKPARAATAGRRGAKKTAAPAPVVTPTAAAARLDRPTAATMATLAEGLSLPPGVTSFDSWFAQPYTLDPDDVVLKPLTKGSRVIGGTILGRVGRASIRREGAARAADRRTERAIARAEGIDRAPHLWFEIRPAGSETPRVDPKPILDGWRLLSATAVYRAKSSLVRGTGTASRLSVGQILLMSKEQLQRHVLDNPEITIYGCGRQDIRAGIIDRRVLAGLEFLVAKGMNPTVTSLRCGHGYYTASGNVSHHTYGSAVDIAAINGTPILGNQGPGSITDKAVRALLTLQGTMKPAQIITLMQYSGTDNTYAMGDHDDHIHLGFDPRESAASSVLKPAQWERLIGSLARVPNPIVPLEPSAYSIAVTKQAQAGSDDDHAHR